MKNTLIVFLIIFSLIVIFPSVDAQVLEKSRQKSIEVTISLSGEVHVTHIIRGQNEPHEIDLLDGIITNLSVKDEEGSEREFGTIGHNESLMLFPSRENIIVEYDLLDALVLQDNFWTMDFIYLESVSFIFPDQIDFIYVNDKPVLLGEKKGIMCHGCQMILEYSLNEPKLLEKVKVQENEYLIEIITWAKINEFELSPQLGGVSFEVSGNKDYVTVIVPVNLLSKPYQVFLDDEKIFFHEYISNGTHTWINMKPQDSGNVVIIGTIIPELDKSDFNKQEIFAFEFVAIIVIVGSVVVIVFILKRRKS